MKGRGCRLKHGVAGSESSQEEDEENRGNWRLSSSGNTNEQSRPSCVYVITAKIRSCKTCPGRAKCL